ncbi:MAG TPA: CvpA family protein [Candidatus Nitrosotalea sp.]|nr:CvpA family protein [Candidatus Nitrosotalea sp.]
MGIDVVIALLLVGAAVVGFQRGVVQPLLVEIFFLGSLLLILHKRSAFGHLLGLVMHANTVTVLFAALVVAVVAGYLGGLLGGFLHRTRVVRGVDGLLGVFIHIGVAFLVCYLGLSILVTLDRAFAPTLNAATLTLTQIQAMQTQLDSNPVTRGLVDGQQYTTLRHQASGGHGAIISQSPQLSQLETIYQDFLQPQLQTSRLARPVLSIGQHIPLIGHVGPSDLPRVPVAPSSPAPSPSP